jgi:hypothetical protein
MIWVDRLALVWLTIVITVLIFAIPMVPGGGFNIWPYAAFWFVGIPWLALRVIHFIVSGSQSMRG